MKENRLIIAAAGSGKTTYLVKNAKIQTGRVLITTFTNENESEIREKFVELYGCVPSHVTIQAWFSFLLQHGVRPYQGTFNDRLYNYRITGVNMVNAQSGIKYYRTFGKKKIPVLYTERDDFLKCYFDDDNRLFTDKIARFVCHSNEISKGKVIKRISAIYPMIYIDEVQDLAGYDLEFLNLLFRSSSTVLCVGDPRQATFYTHWEKKYSTYKHGKIREFVENECRKKDHVVIDTETLMNSHRNNKSICDFSSSLYPDLPKSTPCSCEDCHSMSVEHQGIYLVKKEDINRYIQLFQPVQLRYNKKVEICPSAPCCNFGNSKGKTFNRVLIYPTQDIKKWLKDRSFVLEETTKARLYVAITRARYSVAFVADTKDCSEISDIPVWTEQVHSESHLTT